MSDDNYDEAMREDSKPSHFNFNSNQLGTIKGYYKQLGDAQRTIETEKEAQKDIYTVLKDNFGIDTKTAKKTFAILYKQNKVEEDEAREKQDSLLNALTGIVV